MFQVTTYDVLAVVLISFAVIGVGLWQGRMLGLPRNFSFVMAIAALILAYARYRVELSTPADAINYYLSSLARQSFNVGTDSIPYLTSFFTRQLRLGFLPVMMVYTVVGLMAIQLFYRAFLAVNDATLPQIWHAIFLILVVPSTGFWGSGISKDSLVLLGIALFCWALVKPSGTKLLGIIFGIAIVFVVRPHMGAIMLAALGIGYAQAKDTNAGERWSIIVLGAITAVTVLPLMVEYLGLTNLSSLADVNERVETFTSGFEGSGSYVNISQMSVPMKFVSYFFRPFLWEAASASQLAAAAQNVILAAVFAITLPSILTQSSRLRTVGLATIGMYALIGAVLLANTTANLGVSARQKWMVVIPLLLFAIRSWSLSRRHRVSMLARSAALPTGRAGGAAPARVG